MKSTGKQSAFSRLMHHTQLTLVESVLCERQAMTVGELAKELKASKSHIRKLVYELHDSKDIFARARIEDSIGRITYEYLGKRAMWAYDQKEWRFGRANKLFNAMKKESV